MSGSCSQCGTPQARGYSHCGDHMLANLDASTRAALESHFAANGRNAAARKALIAAGLLERDGSWTYRGSRIVDAHAWIEVGAMLGEEAAQ